MKLLARTAVGNHFWVDNDEGGAVLSVSDVSPIIEANKAAYNHNDGYTKSREMRRVANIPIDLLNHWYVVEGWDPWNPANAKKVMQKLNDPDWRDLRTAPGTLGWTGDGFR